MLKLYLDNCCYNRPFDDLTQKKIADEAFAKMFIQSLIRYKSVALYYSFMSQAELNESPFEDSKAHILDFIENNASAFISDNHLSSLKALSNEIIQTGIKIKDATHLACAIFAKCEYFTTTDKRIIRYKINEIKIVNPVDFVKIWRETV